MRVNNPHVNVMIERFCEQWSGTALGADVWNMYENETPYSLILERMGLDYEEDGYSLYEE